MSQRGAAFHIILIIELAFLFINRKLIREAQ